MGVVLVCLSVAWVNRHSTVKVVLEGGEGVYEQLAVLVRALPAASFPAVAALSHIFLKYFLNIGIARHEQT